MGIIHVLKKDTLEETQMNVKMKEIVTMKEY